VFTLKLFKRIGGLGGELVTRVVAVDHVQTKQIGDKGLSIWAFRGPDPSPYDTYFLGEFGPDADAVDNIDHWGNHFQWGLLENWEGNTSEHYRPASYG
jgi:hypothetical protein